MTAPAPVAQPADPTPSRPRPVGHDTVAGRAIAGLAALCDLLDDDGDLDVDLPPVTIDREAHDDDPAFAYTVASVRTRGQVHHVALTLHTGDGDRDYTVEVVDGIVGDLSDPDPAVDSVLWHVAEDMQAMANGYPAGDDDIDRWLAVVTVTLPRLRARLTDLLDDIDLYDLVAVVSPNPTAVTLAPTWAGDLGTLAQAAGRLERTTTDR